MILSHFPIIELDRVDSTNNYAMQLIDANKAQQGMTIVAREQTAGKGQRGRTWVDTAGKSLLMSIITDPNRPITDQFIFNASIAVAIANVLQKLYNNWHIHIKWPNDIIVNDKKAGGILIENILRGANWAHSVIGFGLNVAQDVFPDELPFATSLKIASGINFDIAYMRDEVRENIMAAVIHPLPAAEVMNVYNQYLYKRHMKQGFVEGERQWEATIINVLPDGTLQVKLDDGEIVCYHHGQMIWNWG